ncbi:MAG: LapA family protein [Candidatus Pacebacteria bacterium]|nr:LapA family protein [Candidatus Paceibacterota bacterium]
MFSFISGFLVAALTVFFAFQNNETVTVRFLGNELTGSLAILIIASMLLGFLVGMIIFLPRAIADNWRARSILRENAQLKKRLGEEPIKYEAPGLGEEGEKSIEIIN